MLELVLVAPLLGNCTIRAKVRSLKSFLDVLVIQNIFLNLGDNKHLLDSAKVVNWYQVERNAMCPKELLLGWGTALDLFLQ